MPWLDDVVRTKCPKRMPLASSTDEVRTVQAHLGPPHDPVVLVLYEFELLVGESVRQRIKGVDFSCRSIVVRDGKSNTDGITVSATGQSLRCGFRWIGRAVAADDESRRRAALFYPCAGKQVPERLIRAGLAAGIPGAAVFCRSLDALIIN